VAPTSIWANVDFHGKPFLAYPNPGKERIAFALPLDQAAVMKVMIYNLTGERVAVLNASLAAGPGKSVTWDCRDMAAGIYVARVMKDGREVGKIKLAVAR